MRTPPPPELASEDIAAVLAEGWDADGAVLEYLPVGAGSYHWRATMADSRRLFVTVDDLEDKPFLGDDADSVFARLVLALHTAVALRIGGGLEFVVAPIAGAGGEVVRRIDDRYALAVYPYLGEPQPFRKVLGGAERQALASMVARLHRVPSGVAHDVPAVEPAVPFRSELERAIDETEELRDDAAVVRDWLARFDGLVALLNRRRVDLVVTHGEPHSGNVLRTARGHVLVDWDTVGLAPPERDLWLIGGGDPELCELYRLRWRLDDLSWAVRDLASERGDERERARRFLRDTVEHEPFTRD